MVVPRVIGVTADVRRGDTGSYVPSAEVARRLPPIHLGEAAHEAFYRCGANERRLAAVAFLRRRRQPAADEFEPPPGVEVPEGMTAVPVEKIDEWAEQLAAEASEMAVSKPAPDFVDLSAKVVIPTVCGRERSDAVAGGGTHQLGYNIFLLGYWCRAVEMRALKTSERSAAVTERLRAVHALGSGEWFGTLQRASYGLAGYDAGEEELIGGLRSVLPQGMGDDFRLRYALTSVLGIRDAIEAEHPGASEPLAPPEMRECWEAGYWMRAVSLSLPDDAQRELADQGQG